MKTVRVLCFAILLTSVVAANAYADEAQKDYSESGIVSLNVNCNHVWSSWYEEPSSCEYKGITWRNCYVCGETESEELPLANHDWSSWDIDKKATKFSSGKKHRYCYDCEKYEYAVIDQKAMTATDKKALKASKKFFNLLRTYSYQKMGPVYASKKKDFVVKNPFKSIYKKQFKKKLSCKILDISSSSKTANLKVKMTSPYAYRNYYNTYTSWMYWYLKKYPSVSKKASQDKLSKMMAKCISGNKMYKSTKTFTVKLKKTGGKWKVVPDATLRDRLDAGMRASFRDFKNDWI